MVMRRVGELLNDDGLTDLHGKGEMRYSGVEGHVRRIGMSRRFRTVWKALRQYTLKN